MESFQIIETTFGPLRVLNYTKNKECFLILWNEFCIMIKNADNLSCTQVFHYTDFCIKDMLFVENIFLCLDSDKNLHFTILKKKNESCILESLEFKPIMKNVICMFNTEADIYILLEKENEVQLYSYNLIGTSKMKIKMINKIDFDIKSQCSDTQIVIKDLKCFPLDFITNVFHIQISRINLESQLLLLLNQNVLYWAFLEAENKKKIVLSTLYTSPVTITSLLISKEHSIQIYLSLKTGSMVILSYDIIEKRLDADVVHLNSSIEKIICVKDCIIYTDRENIWSTWVKSHNDDILLSHQNLKISMPYDFMYSHSNSYIYCTTCHNTIYKVYFESNSKSNHSEDGILVPKNLDEVEKIVFEIQNETKRNETVLNTIIEEDSYITITFLNKKRNLIANHVNLSFKICNTSDIEKSNDIYILDNNDFYYENNTNIYLLKFETSKYFSDKLDKMVNVNANLLHLDISLTAQGSQQSVNFCVPLKKASNISIALPIKNDLGLPIKAKIIIVALTPGVLNKDHKFWAMISTNTFHINSSYHFECPDENNRKRLKKEFGARICSIALKNCGLVDISNHKKYTNLFCLYIRLPCSWEKYANCFADHFVKNLSSDNAECIKTKFCNADFIHNHKEIILKSLNFDISIVIENTTNIFKRMKISCTDLNMCWDVYNFILDILKSMDNKSWDKGVPHFDYVILQNLRENFRSVTNSTDHNREEVMEISESFYRDVVGILPI